MLSWALVAFLFGVGVASVVSVPALLLWIVLVFVALVLAFAPRRAYPVLLVSASVFMLGAWRFSFADQPTPLEHQVGQEVELTGYVDSDFRKTKSGGQFYFRARTLNDEPVNERLLVRTERWPELQFGTPLVLSGMLELPWEGDDFDYRAYLKKDGVRVLLERPDMNGLSRLPLPVGTYLGVAVRDVLGTLRVNMRTNIQAGVSEPASAYLNGIILGVREDLPVHISEAFSRTGTTHVLAISGYNVAIVAQGFMLLCLRVMDRQRAVWLAVAGIAAFALLTGAAASVVRAAIMGSLALVTHAWGRNIYAMNLILIAAVTMVAFNPYLLVHDVGFQLSFAAVLGLIYLSPWFENAWTPHHRYRDVWGMTVATGAANIATLPLILVHFGTLPVYSLPANVMILPLVPYAMAGGAFSGALAWMWPALADVVAFPAWALATWQLAVVQWFGRLPWASIAVPLTWSMIGVLYAGLIILYVRYGDRRSHHSTT